VKVDLQAQQQETRDAVVGFVLLLGVMAAHGIMETARDTLFLSRIPAEHLPFAYLALAGLAAAAARLNRRMLRAMHDKRLVLASTLGVVAAVTLLLSFTLGRGDQRPAYVFYVWTGLVSTVVVVQLWLLLENVVTVTQAKRVFGYVAAGGVLGATVGSFIADQLVPYVEPHQLVYVASGIFAASAFTPFLWHRERLTEAPTPRRKAGRRNERQRSTVVELCSEPYLRLLLVLIVLSTVTVTSVDYIFKSVVAREVATANLGSFFARTYLVLNAIALVVQVGLSSWLLGSFGVNRALLLFPLLLLLGTTGFFLLGPLVGALAIKGADGSLRHSIHRTGLEILYLPVPRDARERYKTVIDGVGNRGGQALASLAILGMTYLGFGAKALAIAVVVLATVWLVTLIFIKRRYVELFRFNLREGTIETRIGLTELDLHSLESLLGALNSEHDEEVLAALELFERHDKVHLIPVLILYHPSESVVLRALELFADTERTDFVSVARRLLRHESPIIRAASLRTLAAIAPDPKLLEEAREDESPLVQATALVGLLAHEFGDREELTAALDELVSKGHKETRRALAEAIRRERRSGFETTLKRLARDGDIEVQRAAARAMEAAPSEDFLEVLLPMLAHGPLRSTARRAIVAVGSEALSYLDRVLWDLDQPRGIRRHLPRTISRLEPRRAASVLLRHLSEEPDRAVRYKILRGLGRLRADHPDLPLDRDLLSQLLHSSVQRAAQMLDWRLATEKAQADEERLQTPGGELLVGVLREKEDGSLERAFRLMALLHEGEDFQLLWHGLQSEDRRIRAASREVLSHVVTGRERSAVLALVADGSDEERLADVLTALGTKPERPTYQERLVSMLQDRSEAVRSIAAHHIGELGLTELKGSLERARPKQRSYLSEVIERALSALDRPGAPHVA
jgi:ATP/ADP translocase